MNQSLISGPRDDQQGSSVHYLTLKDCIQLVFWLLRGQDPETMLKQRGDSVAKQRALPQQSIQVMDLTRMMSCTWLQLHDQNSEEHTLTNNLCIHYKIYTVTLLCAQIFTLHKIHMCNVQRYTVFKQYKYILTWYFTQMFHTEAGDKTTSSTKQISTSSWSVVIYGRYHYRLYSVLQTCFNLTKQ